MPKFVLIFYIYSSNHSLPRFWFYLRYTNKSTFGLYMLSCNPFYTKLSVVLFPVVLRVANFLLPYFCSVVSLLCKKPVVWRFSTNYARSFYCSQFGGESFVVFVCIKLLGNVVRVYPRIVQGLTFLSA